jgi:ethanolamine utilization microcompartment shell protein EutS
LPFIYQFSLSYVVLGHVSTIEENLKKSRKALYSLMGSGLHGRMV